MPLKVDIEKKQEGYYVISPVGSIDSDTYMELDNKIAGILDKTTVAIMLNMAGVTYVSSVGFSIIFRTKQALEKNKGSLAIANLQPNVKKIFEAVKVIPETLFATMKDADQYLDTYIESINKDGDGKKR